MRGPRWIVGLVVAVHERAHRIHLARPTEMAALVADVAAEIRSGR
jgi:hypothetical protein